MKLRSVTTITALAVLAVSLFTGAASADASIITMQFTGTVMPPGAGPVFGESGSSTPFDFSMTYDTSKGAELAFHDGDPGDDDLWAYSAAGITAVSLTFGTKTWTLDDLQPARELGTTADFWTNSDLTLAAPTALQIYFRDGDGSLDLGNVYLRGGQALFKSVEIHDNSQGGVDGYMIGTYTLTTSVAPAAVPEPASLLFLGSGLVGLVARLRSSKQRSPMKQP
jgi:hypothetical protein